MEHDPISTVILTLPFLELLLILHVILTTDKYISVSFFLPISVLHTHKQVPALMPLDKNKPFV